MSDIPTITIRYSDARSATRLDAMLGILGDEARTATWGLRSVECVGSQANHLHALSDSGTSISGTDLLAVASGIDQVVDGEFRAYGTGEAEAWLILRAVDSSSWDVATSREEILNRYRAAYKVYEAGKMNWGS